MSYETAVLHSLPTSAPSSSNCVVQDIQSTYRLRSAPHSYCAEWRVYVSCSELRN